MAEVFNSRWLPHLEPQVRQEVQQWLIDAIGPCQCTPPKEFHGREENFEEFAFEMKSYRFLIYAGYETALKSIYAIS